MVRPLPGLLWQSETRMKANEPYFNGRLYFAHSDMSGLSIFEEAQYRGTKAAEEVLVNLGYSIQRLA